MESCLLLRLAIIRLSCTCATMVSTCIPYNVLGKLPWGFTKVYLGVSLVMAFKIKCINQYHIQLNTFNRDMALAWIVHSFLLKPAYRRDLDSPNVDFRTSRWHIPYLYSEEDPSEKRVYKLLKMILNRLKQKFAALKTDSYNN